MNDAKEEIRDRLNIEDVVGEYLELKRAGRNFKALSPFSNEKTPSFIVSPDKRIWHDFSSGKGGDVFSFIMEVEGLDFKEALKLLAKKAGVELKYFDNANSKKVAKQKEREFALNELVAKYFQATLAKNQHALDYVKVKRKFNNQTIRDFQLGYAPNSKQALVNFLLKRGFSKKELAQAGLTNQYGGDLFRARIIIPLRNVAGKVVGFTGRGLTPEAVPKYLNTPSTLLFDKSRFLFGLDLAKESIRKLNTVVAVEGHLDAVSSHQAGIKNVVATGGTALTTSHLKLLSRFTSDIRFAFDGDAAGVRATERAIELAQEVGVDVKIISLPDGFKDPDELVQKSVKKWQQAIETAVPAVDWLIEVYKEQFDLSSSQGKRDYSRKLLRVINNLNDPVERETYLKKLADELDVSLESLAQQYDLNQAKITKRKKMIKTEQQATPDTFLYQDNLLAIGLINLTVRVEIAKLVKDVLVGAKRQQMWQVYRDNIDNLKIEQWPDLKDFIVYAKVLELRANERYGSWDNDEQIAEANSLLLQVKKDSKKTKINQLTDLLRAAEASGDDAQAKQVREQINQIFKESK